MYELVVRNHWKDHPTLPARLQPDLVGDPFIVKQDIETEAEAVAACQKYNASHAPGRLTRKAEYRATRQEALSNG